ncbi:hypothetical protein E2C01_020873 [Portunus trituberculatus]|uniref:Uncharacterized protein n=1 Tax=Portunus trituberculatus TaxID=210409 RepID=A0A5B7E4L6_PORTR|nr:hypothetical protein [Portunus trituberculatus]
MNMKTHHGTEGINDFDTNVLVMNSMDLL